jgi:hypothetical protein
MALHVALMWFPLQPAHIHILSRNCLGFTNLSPVGVTSSACPVWAVWLATCIEVGVVAGMMYPKQPSHDTHSRTHTDGSYAVISASAAK